MVPGREHHVRAVEPQDTSQLGSHYIGGSSVETLLQRNGQTRDHHRSADFLGATYWRPRSALAHSGLQCPCEEVHMDARELVG